MENLYSILWIIINIILLVGIFISKLRLPYKILSIIIVTISQMAWFYYNKNTDDTLDLNYKIKQRGWNPVHDSHKIVDKLLVKDIVKKLNSKCKVANTLDIVSNPDNIDIKKLPKSFVMKSNHGCHNNIIVKDGYILNKNVAVTNNYLINNCKKWLKSEYRSDSEKQYNNIDKKVFFEEFMPDMVDHEFKFMCFYGKAKYIEYHSDRFSSHKSNLYEIIDNNNWKYISDYVIWEEDVLGDIVEKPKNFTEMVEIAESLSSILDFARVDLYSINENVYLGEITLTPGGGTYKFVKPNTKIVNTEFTKKISKEWVYDMTNYIKGFFPEVIVSLTTIPSRIKNTYETINSLLNQKYGFFSVYLYISDDMEIPETLLKIKDNRFHIKRVKHIGPATKFVYAIEDHSDKLIAICDDDQIYDKLWLINLVSKSSQYNYDVAVGLSGFIPKSDYVDKNNDIYIDKNGTVLGYKIIGNNIETDMGIIWPQGYTGYLLPVFKKKMSMLQLYEHCKNIVSNSNNMKLQYPKDMTFIPDDLVVGVVCYLQSIPIILAKNNLKQKELQTSINGSINNSQDNYSKIFGENMSSTVYKDFIKNSLLPVSNVPRNWLNKYFSSIYVITMPNKLEHVKKSIEYLNIDAKIFNAVHKNSLEKNDLILQNKITKDCKLNMGRIACHMSHIKVLETFLESKEDKCFIFEDDFLLDKPQWWYFSQIVKGISNVPTDWDIINFGTCHEICAKRKHISNNIFSSYVPKCRNAYAVTRKGAEIIIKHTIPMRKMIPGDESIAILTRDNILIGYQTFPVIFSQNRTDFKSDLGNHDKLRGCK